MQIDGAPRAAGHVNWCSMSRDTPKIQAPQPTYMSLPTPLLPGHPYRHPQPSKMMYQLAVPADHYLPRSKCRMEIQSISERKKLLVLDGPEHKVRSFASTIAFTIRKRYAVKYIPFLYTIGDESGSIVDDMLQKLTSMSRGSQRRHLLRMDFGTIWSQDQKPNGRARTCESEVHPGICFEKSLSHATFHALLDRLPKGVMLLPERRFHALRICDTRHPKMRILSARVDPFGKIEVEDTPRVEGSVIIHPDAGGLDSRILLLSKEEGKIPWGAGIKAAEHVHLGRSRLDRFLCLDPVPLLRQESIFLHQETGARIHAVTDFGGGFIKHHLYVEWEFYLGEGSTCTDRHALASFLQAGLSVLGLKKELFDRLIGETDGKYNSSA